MKQRILVAIIGVPALIGVLCFAPDWATAVLVAALCVIGCHKCAACPLREICRAGESGALVGAGGHVGGVHRVHGVFQRR